MSADESFLARWSRRKRSVATGERPPSPTTTDKGSGPALGSEPAPVPPIDLASLPPIESIGAGSDLTPFLAPGVPAALMRAALRRAWSADPAIRDFIGLAENAWDFTAPNGVPGFGSLTPEEVERLVAQISGGTDEAEGSGSAAEPASAEQVAVNDTRSLDHAPFRPPAEPRPEPAARQSARLPRQRRHGGALPE